MTTPTSPVGRNFRDESGNPIVPGRQLGVGGEGTIFSVDGQPGSVMKIWHPGNTPDEAEAKIAYLVKNPVKPALGATWSITWPESAVKESGVIVGYTMPIYQGDPGEWESMEQYYIRRAARSTGAAQAREIQIDDRVRMARNLALGFKAVHEAGYVIGDVNEKNVVVNRQNDITLVDCDSYSFTDPATGETYSNNKGRAEFQAPEVQGGYVDRTHNHDYFGLAVLIFHLLTGSHPYRVTGSHARDYPEPGARIEAWLFPPARGDVTAPPDYNTAWDALTGKQQELFLRCFDQKYEGDPRPTPEEWIEALMELPAVVTPPPAPASRGPAPASPGTAPSGAMATAPGPVSPGAGAIPAPAAPTSTLRRYYTPPASNSSDLLMFGLAAVGYGMLIPLLFFNDFRLWWWLGLTVAAGAAFYLPVQRLLQPPIAGMRWVMIVAAVLVSALFVILLLENAIAVWPWWMWLVMGVGAAFVFAVPARSVFSSPNVWRRRIAIAGVSLLALFILGSLVWSVVRDVWFDDGGSLGASSTASADSSGTGAASGNPAPPGSGDAVPSETLPTPGGAMPLAVPDIADVIDAAMPGIVEIRAGAGSGTGFIVHEDGLVITNRHVVGDTGQVGIRLATGGDYTGTVLGVHPTLDLAYIDIESDSVFRPLALGDSDAARVGADVIAIGFPLGADLGEDPTVTTGIISAKRQDLDYLQTDADLNPGNSGGPLLDEYGCVVGINTAGIEGTGDGQVVTGINFAIPVNDLREALSDVANIPVCEGRQPEGMAVVPPETPTPTPIPAPTPDISATVSAGVEATRAADPTPLPTSTPTPLQPTPTPTPEPTLTPTPMPTPTPAPTLTPTPTPRPTATPRPTSTPLPTATPRPTPTPTPAPTPTRSWFWATHEDTTHKYTIKYERAFALTGPLSAKGSPFLQIHAKEFESGESTSLFFQRHRQELLDAAPEYHLFEPGSTRGETIDGRNYIHMEYLIQPRADDCVYHVVEHIFRSRFYPAKDVGFIISTGICDLQLADFGQIRELILQGFEEYN